MKPSISPAALLFRLIAVAGAIGLASPASVALAQAGHGGKSASSDAASRLGAVSGVVVQAPSKTSRMPPDKKAALDAEAAKRKAWKKYRTTTPAPMPASMPTAGMSASARAENYPGLHTLPH
jgi:hypothetical protein